MKTRARIRQKPKDTSTTTKTQKVKSRNQGDWPSVFLLRILPNDSISKVVPMPKFIINFTVLMLVTSLCEAQERRIELSPEGAPAIIIQSQGNSGEILINGGGGPNSITLIPQEPVPQVVPPATKPEVSPGRRGKSRMVPTLPKEYEARDKNGDGQIGLYEWDRAKYSEFVKLDKNGDGFLTPAELNAKGNVFGSRMKGGVLEKDALPNPGNMLTYGQKIGESFTFSVVGRTSSAVYGTGTYTGDSDLASAAVHAGLVKDGEKGVVTVTIVESPNQFTGSAANGVTSSSWQAYPSAYTVR